MAEIAFEYITKSYEPSRYALAGLNLGIEHGELISLIGPSGCGKTTALRILAGLESHDGGHIRVDGAVVDDIPTHARGFGMVTAEAALMRKRSAAANMRFPLEVRRRPAREIRDRVELEAESLRIGHLLKRRTQQLSAGEAQAVQVARALVTRPRAFLLDEPLARIDSTLRSRLRDDLIRLQRRYDVTTLLATADQADAMAMSHRIAMLVDGRLHQLGTPTELYNHPVNSAVARFIGEPGMNVLTIAVRARGDERWYDFGGHEIPAYPEVTRRYAGRSLLVGIRPEHVGIESVGAPRTLPATVARAESTGGHAIIGADAGPHHVSVLVTGAGPRIGDRIGLRLDPAAFHLFDDLTEAAVHHPGG
ncbi:MAG: ABC transporter ATP-binding protein [Acidimicrobiia bacterium]|nr:ABC transporter ATP-binding protein [Acidimicrobiia bacterium]